MIIELPNFISAEEIAEIKQLLEPEMPTVQTYSYNREGKTIFITENPNLKHLDEKLIKIFTRIKKDVVDFRYKPQYPTGDSGYEYHKYGPGQICHYHADCEFATLNDPNYFKLRFASVVLHLNTIEEGGELVFPAQNESVKTEAGKVVIFPPYATHAHYTTPAKVDREIIVTWFTYANILLHFQK